MAEKPIKIGDSVVGTWFYDCESGENDPSLDVEVTFAGEIEVTGLKKAVGSLGKLIPDEKFKKMADEFKGYVPSGSVGVVIRY